MDTCGYFRTVPKKEKTKKQSVQDVIDALDGGKDAQITADAETIQKALDIWVKQDSSGPPQN